MRTFKFVFLLLSYSLCFFCCKEENVPDTDFIEFALRIEEQIGEQDETFLVNAFDYEEFEKRVVKNLTIPKEQKEEASRFITENTNPAGTILESVQDGADFHFVKFYRKNKEPHLLFRTYYNGGVSLEDWTLGVKDGKIRIYDAFAIVSGIYWSDDCRQKLCNQLELFTDEVLTINKLIDINYLISTENYADADSLLYWIMPQMNDNMYARTMELNLASMHKSYPEVQRLAKAFMLTFQDENRIAVFYLMQSSIRHGLVDETTNHIQTLIDLIGDDPIYYVYQAWSFQQINAFQYALQSLDSAMKYMPHIFDLYLNKLDVYYIQYDYPQCVALLHRIDSLFMPSDEDASFFQTNYPKLREYKPFNEWIAEKEVREVRKLEK
jgi:hypothetical protein